MKLPAHGTIRTVGHPLCGFRVDLQRRRIGDDGGWFAVVEDISQERRELAGGALPFPADDPHGRGTHTLLYPEDITP